MKICEYAFQREDEDNPGYSMHEVDYYAWIPASKRTVMPNHRLSLRRNLVDKVWELYRAFSKKVVLHGYGESIEAESWQVIITHKPTGTEAIAFTTKDFAEALRWGNNEWNRWHKTPDYTREPDTPCDHGGDRSLSCPIKHCKVNPCEYMGNCPNPGHPEIWCYYDELDKETEEPRADNRNQETG